MPKGSGMGSHKPKIPDVTLWLVSEAIRSQKDRYLRIGRQFFCMLHRIRGFHCADSRSNPNPMEMRIGQFPDFAAPRKSDTFHWFGMEQEEMQWAP